MRIGILQPGYLPWLGFFEQLYRSDVFVIYDDVQYDREGWRNRNRIKTPRGAGWLTVPVHAPFRERLLIKDVRIDNGTDWRKKHLSTLRANYSRAPFAAAYLPLFEDGYRREWEYLADLDMHFILRLAESLGLGDKKIVSSSTIGITGERIERLIALCRHFGADVFYEGEAGRNYIAEEAFSAHGIRVEYQEYRHPEYPQLFGPFVSHLSVVDLLFNHGPESLRILANRQSGEE